MASVKPHGHEVAKVKVMVGSAVQCRDSDRLENRKKLLISILCVSSALIVQSWGVCMMLHVAAETRYTTVFKVC